jgi:hypothetical protein
VLKGLYSTGLALCCATGLWLTTGLGASASVDWCSGDPPVHLILPSGKPLEANVHVSVPQGEQAGLQAATVTGTVVSVQGATAQVVAAVVVPPEGGAAFPVTVSADSHGPNNSIGTPVQGTAGETIDVTFSVTLPPGLQ